MMITVGLDLYIGDSADQDNCGGGSISSIKVYETGGCIIHHSGPRPCYSYRL